MFLGRIDPYSGGKRMKGKRLAACVLTGLLLFGTGAETVMARHAAEERGEQKQIERMERWQRDQVILQREKEAEARREERAAAERERRAAKEKADAERRQAEAEAAEAERAAEERAEAEAARERALEEAEARAEAARASQEQARAEAEIKAAQEKAAAAAKAAEEKARAEEEARAARERAEAEAKAEAERHQAAERTAAPSNENTAGTDSILGKYLRKNDEKSQNTAAPQKQQEEKMVTYTAKNNMQFKRLEVNSMDVGGTLLFSDSPEYVKQPGIMYSDIVKGDARILYYHLNDMPMMCKVAVILENTVDQYAVVHITRKGLSAPSDEYLKVGRETQRQYFKEQQKQESLYIDGHQSRVMSEVMDTTLVCPGELVYGLFDFSSNVPVRATVIVYPAAANPLDFVKHAPILPKDGPQLRGTFTGMDRIMKARDEYNPRKDGPVYITIGNTVDDKFKQGIDATDGSLVENTGNYGVLYHLEVPMRGRKKAQLWANPMGGVYTGATRVNTDGPAGSWMCMVPADAPFFGHIEGAPVPLPKEDGTLDIVKGTEMFCLGDFKGETLHFEFSPPGASNLPVRFMLKEP